MTTKSNDYELYDTTKNTGDKTRENRKILANHTKTRKKQENYAEISSSAITQKSPVAVTAEYGINIWPSLLFSRFND